MRSINLRECRVLSWLWPSVAPASMRFGCVGCVRINFAGGFLPLPLAGVTDIPSRNGNYSDRRTARRLGWVVASRWVAKTSAARSVQGVHVPLSPIATPAPRSCRRRALCLCVAVPVDRPARLRI